MTSLGAPATLVKLSHLILIPLKCDLICSWGSGANPWGPEKEDHFTKPNHYDGMLEIVGVSGVVHMGQIQSGLRSASRIAQGGHVSNEFLQSLAHTVAQ